MARRAQLAFANPVTATGATAAIDYQGGYGALFISGTFGATSVQLQQQGPDAQWYDMLGTPVTLPNKENGFLAPAGPLRLFLTGGAGISISAWVVGIPSNAGG